MEMKSNLFLIFKEAVNNLVKYSGCTQAVLTLSFDEQQIHLSVEDNGQGFEIDEMKARGGLSNMQHRAEEIEGEGNNELSNERTCCSIQIIETPSSIFKILNAGIL